MLEDFTFTVPVGFEEKTVRIVHVHELSRSLCVDIDRHDIGGLDYENGRWKFLPIDSLSFTTDDIQLLEEIVNRRFPNGFD